MNISRFVMIVGLAACPCASMAQDSFELLGDLMGSGPNSYSQALGISADGNVVVGSASSALGEQAFSWTRSGGMIGLGLPDLFGPKYPCCRVTQATAAAADGSVIAGIEVETENGNIKAWRWTAATGIVEISAPDQFAGARAISLDGSAIAGELYTGFLFAVGYTWTQPTGIVSIDPSPANQSLVWGMSGDGSVLGGTYGGFPQSEPFIWTSAGGFNLLGDFPGGPGYSGANALSTEGTTLAGFGSIAPNVFRAMRWTQATGLVNLGVLPGTSLSSSFAVNADGSVVGGNSFSGGGSGDHAFIWNATDGMQSLESLLISRGVDLQGYHLSIVYGMSADGRTFVGSALSPTLSRQGFVAHLGGVCYANCDGSTAPPVLNVNDFICFQTHFAAGDSFANCDASTTPPVLNINDFICFQGRFAAGCP